MKQAAAFKYKSVLLIDDDAIHSFITERLLKAYLFSKEVIVHENSNNALDYLKQMQGKKMPDYIFLDICLPVIDGFEFLSEFENLSPPCQSKVVVLTASIAPEDKERAKEFKCVVDWIAKPLSEDALMLL
jgi:CheY-like chemotaxis protein